MTGANWNHLSDEQMNDALLGDLAAETAGHLAACVTCQRRVATARMPLESFKAVTLAWSERRSATMPTSLQERMLHNATGSRRRAWSTAAAAVLAFAFAVPYGVQRYSGSLNAPVESRQAMRRLGSVVGEANAAEIARDNQMLNEIDSEINSSRTSSEALELQGAQGKGGTTPSSQMFQD